MGYGDNKHKNIWDSELPEMQYAKKVIQDPLLRKEVKIRFRKRKWMYRIITLSIIFISILFMNHYVNLENKDWLLPLMLFFDFIFWYVSGLLIYRCPACNFGLSFTNMRVTPIPGGVITTGDKNNDWSSKSSCPRCRNQLS